MINFKFEFNLFNDSYYFYERLIVLAFSLIPTIILSWFILYTDRKNKEPAKNIIICLLLLTVFVVLTRPKNVDASTSDDYPSIKLGYEFKKLEFITNLNIHEEESNKITYNLDYYLEEKKDTIAFFAKAFGYNYNDVIKDLQTKNDKEEVFLMTNIGFLKNKNNEQYEKSKIFRSSIAGDVFTRSFRTASVYCSG